MDRRAAWGSGASVRFAPTRSQMALTPKGEGMKVNSKWWVTLVGLLVLLASSSALAGSTAAKPRFQNSYVCVNLHDGLIKVISRRQHNRCATGWKRYKVSDIFGKGMRGAQGTPGPRGPAGAAGTQGAQGANGAQGPQGFMGLQGLIGPGGPQGDIGPMGQMGRASCRERVS